MKVAYVVSLFPKMSETFILREMQRLRERGVEIAVVSLKSKREAMMQPGAGDFLADVIEAPSPVVAAAAFARRLLVQPLTVSRLLLTLLRAHVGRPSLLLKALPLLPVGAAVADRLARLKVDHVHAHWATYPAQVAWTIHLLEGIPYSLTAHAHDIFLPNPMLAEKVRASEFTATISEFNVARLREICGDGAQAKVRLVRCGVSLGEHRLRPGPPPKEERLVSVGRLVDYKGFATLIEAVSILRRRGRPVTCDIAGEGPDHTELERAIRGRGLEGAVRLRGALAQPEVRSLMEGARVCVLACAVGRDGQMDGVPVVLMEALALGLPAVSTRISGIPELIEDGKTGLLVAPGDAGEMAAAIARMLDDADLASRVAAEGRRRVEARHDAARNADALLDLIQASGGGSGR